MPRAWALRPKLAPLLAAVLQVVVRRIHPGSRYVRIGQQVQGRIEIVFVFPLQLIGRRRLDEALGNPVAGHLVRNHFTGNDVLQRAERDAAVERIGHHRRVISAVLEEVVRHLRPAGALWVQLLGAAMHQVRCPDQRLSLLRMEVIRFCFVRLHQIPPHCFVDRLGFRPFQLGDALADMLVRIDGPTVAAGEVDQRAIGFIDIFHGHPHAAHKAFRAGAEMDRVRVEVLLGADREIQRLEGPGLAAVELRQQGEDFLVAGDAFYVLVKGPGILDAQADAGLVALCAPAVEVVVAVQILLDRLCHLVEIGIGEVEYCVAFYCKFEGDAAGFRGDGFVEDAGEEGGFDVGDAGEGIVEIDGHLIF